MPYVGERYLRARGDKTGAICPIGGQSCKFQRYALAATLEYLTGEFNGDCTAAETRSRMSWAKETRTLSCDVDYKDG
jgi:hypothetical protein